MFFCTIVLTSFSDTSFIQIIIKNPQPMKKLQKIPTNKPEKKKQGNIKDKEEP